MVGERERENERKRCTKRRKSELTAVLTFAQNKEESQIERRNCSLTLFTAQVTKRANVNTKLICITLRKGFNLFFRRVVRS